MSNPIISICIPTRNRFFALRNTIDSILSSEKFQKSFDIEIIISDNASIDETQEYCLSIVQKYNGKIKYFRNEIDLGDTNFEIVMRNATGKFRKLHNDSFLITHQFWNDVLPLIGQLSSVRPMLIFANGNSLNKTESVYICNDGNDMLHQLQQYLTWIGAFGLWEDTLLKRPDFGRMSHRKFIQVDNILRHLGDNGKFIILNNVYFIGQKFNKQVDYNIAEIFGDNLIDMFKPYVQSGHISNEVFIEFKHNLLFKHILPYHFGGELGSHQTGFNRFLNNYFNDATYLELIEKHYTPSIGYDGNKRLLLNRFIWEKINSHNQTTIANYFDIGKVHVGSRTYGTINASTWGADAEKLEIGSLCSIGDDVKFMLGGNHDYHYLTTYPFKVKLGLLENEASSKGAITVEDDVWIGNNCTILSGVTIGKGAVIGTGSVVTKDIPSYAIAAGNPAKVMRYRFSDNLIYLLKKIDLKKLANLENLEEHIKFLYLKINSENIDEILKYFQKLDCLVMD